MNKKISTLMAGVALMGAMSVGAQTQVPVTKPAATVVGSGTSLANGDVVYLNYNANWQIDFTGTDPKAQKDSLIFKDFGTSGLVGRSKAHIDSLLFKVDYKENKLVYGCSVGSEYTFTFTSKAGKFAFAKPAAGKKAAAYLKTDGELNQWILPSAYLSTDGTAASGALGYAPYFVASRTSETDKTPKTVYVLATNMTTNAVEILEINYHTALTGQLTAATIGVAFDETTGIGQLVANSAANKTHNLYRITGCKVTDTNILVTPTTIKDAIGYETPSFAFTQGVSEGEDNLLAAYNWEYDTNQNLKAIGAQQPGTGYPLYLTVDTFYYDEANKQNFKLALDTLPGASGTTVNTDMIRNADTYKFTINATFGKDSISIVPQNVPALTGNYFKGNNQIAVTTNTLPIIIKTFGDKTVLTVQHSNDTGIAAPAITASETPTWTLTDKEIAQFTEGNIYTLFDANKMKADKKMVNPDYGKALIIDNMSSRYSQVWVDTEKFDETLPSHQWVVLKENNVYSFKNRETGADLDDNLVDGTALTNVQLYVVDADENLYTYGSGADTIKLVRYTKTVSPFDGYRVITQEEQMNQVFNLRFVSDLLGEEAYVQQGEDSVMNVAIGNADNAAEIRFLDTYVGDTIKIGVEDHQLTVVPYAVKIGRYFLAYDDEKKVYRFTTKQWNEAEGEAAPANYYNEFVITKLAGGNIALVPWYTIEGGYNSQEKLAIDSENGNAVRVALDSDLRHAFELTEPVNRIFAEVLNGKDTTLVKANFHSVENLGWSLAKGDDDFLYEGVPSELRAGGAEYANEAFDFLLDTAYVNRPGNTMPLYYITFGAARKDSIPVEHIHDGGADHVCPPDMPNDTVTGKFLFIMMDSLTVNPTRENMLKYGYTYNYNTYAKLQMIPAKHIVDTLIVDRPNATAIDTLKAGKIADNATVEQMQGQWLNNENKALFAFRVNMDNDEEYAIYNPATDLYLTYLNGFVVATTEAAFYTLEAENGSATANEEIETSVSEVKVIAGAGQITINGAAGKKVVVSNILGQVVANTVLTSDNATIAAPKGIVVVAVEGEEAVKAIVK